jgi:hypothetical protein
MSNYSLKIENTFASNYFYHLILFLDVAGKSKTGSQFLMVLYKLKKMYGINSDNFMPGMIVFLLLFNVKRVN